VGVFSQPTTEVVAMRLALFVAAVLAALVCTPVAGAWSWPADGALLQAFVFDPAHPYAASEHRGLDVAGAAGSGVRAPRAGVVTFAGTVPGSGASLTIATADGYSVTLTHLGPLAVARGVSVGEGDVVAAFGPGGGEHPQPYLHLGVRRTAEAQGYVDPASLLPPRVAPGPPPVTQPPPPSESTASAPVAGPTPAPAPAVQPPVDQAPAVASAAPAAVPAPAEAAPRPVADAPGLVIRAAARASVHVLRPRRSVSAPAPVVAAQPPAVAAQPQSVSRPVALPRPHAGPVTPPVRHFDARRDPLTGERPEPRATAAPVAPVPRHALPLVPLAVLAAVLAGAIAGALAASAARPGSRMAARMMERHVDEPAKDPGGAGLAVRGWVPAPGPRRRVRAVRRVRALPPAEGQSRARGEWHRRARYARDGRG
jgi:hypothetical protein